MRRLAKFVYQTSGAAAVEMALILPLLMILMFTTFEAAHYMYVEHQVVKGVRDGARFGARQPFVKFDCSGTVDNDTATLIKNVTRTGTVSGGISRVNSWDNEDITLVALCPDVTSGIYTGMTNARTLTVSATVAYDSLFNSLTGLQLINIPVFATQQAAVMGI